MRMPLQNWKLSVWSGAFIVTLLGSAANAGASSLYAREGKMVEFLVGTDGFTAGGYLGPQTVLELQFDVIEEEEEKGEYEPYADRYAFSLKRFVGNSSYGRIGVAYDSFWLDDSRSVTPYREVLYGTLGFGNQWQWDVLTVGVRWAELQVPLMTKVKVPSEEKIHESDGDDHLLVSRRKDPWNFELLQLQVGVSF